MRDSWRDYVNIFLLGALLFLCVDPLKAYLGYGYSPIVGVFSIENKTRYLMVSFVMAAVFIVLDIIYVQLKRHYRKKGMYKEDE